MITIAASVLTIRLAADGDVPSLIVMATHFLEQTHYGETIPVTPTRIEAKVRRLMDIGVVLVADGPIGPVGMVAGLVYEHFLTDSQTANEAWLWVEPESRGGHIADDLMDALEAWARQRGAARLEVGSYRPALDRWYLRRGFTPRERIFAKELLP